MRLRVHHLLCSALFVGKGYSENFCKNMQKVVDSLWEETPQTEHAGVQEQETEQELEVELIVQPDSICKECPNLTKEGCSLDDNNVVSKDARLARALQLETNKVYPVSVLLHQVKENLTKEIFETSCHRCEWYQMGLCSYEKLAEKYRGYK